MITNRWFVLLVYGCFMFTLSCAKVNRVPGENGYTPWMSHRDYQNEFNRQDSRRFYPKQVEGREFNGVNQYRALFVSVPNYQFGFYSHHGLTVDLYNKKHAEYSSRGFKQVWRQEFTSSSGQTFIQATWEKY